MWCNHPFSQKNKTTERAVGWGLEATKKVVRQNLKKKGGGVGNIGVFS